MKKEDHEFTLKLLPLGHEISFLFIILIILLNDIIFLITPPIQLFSPQLEGTEYRPAIILFSLMII